MLSFGNGLKSRRKSCHSISLNCLNLDDGNGDISISDKDTSNCWNWIFAFLGENIFSFPFYEMENVCVSFRGRQAMAHDGHNLHVACNRAAVCLLFASRKHWDISFAVVVARVWNCGHRIHSFTGYAWSQSRKSTISPMCSVWPPMVENERHWASAVVVDEFQGKRSLIA